MILYLFRPRVKLVWASPHSWTFLLQAPPTPAQGVTANQATVLPTFNVYTASIYIGNLGRVAATEIELTFNWQPANYNIWPARPYETHTSADNRFTLKFANLAPREQFQIEFLENKKLPVLIGVRSKECVGKQIQMRAFKVFPRWVYAVFWGLVILGIAAIVYVVIKLGSIIF